jgi:hypothetical protein
MRSARWSAMLDRKEIIMFWAMLIATLEVIGIYFVLTVVSSTWQRRNSVSFRRDDNVSNSLPV